MNILQAYEERVAENKAYVGREKHVARSERMRRACRRSKEEEHNADVFGERGNQHTTYVGGEKHVARLDVPVHNVEGMKVRYSAHDVPHHLLRRAPTLHPSLHNVH